jgi:hypothetical protein
MPKTQAQLHELAKQIRDAAGVLQRALTDSAHKDAITCAIYAEAAAHAFHARVAAEQVCHATRELQVDP